MEAKQDKRGDCRHHHPGDCVRQIDGVERTVDVRYALAGTTTYSKPKSLRKGKKKKMYKYTYNNSSKPYFYKIQYRDKPTVKTTIVI